MSDAKHESSINIAPYIPKFVRCFHSDEDRVLETPYSYTQFGAVLMVDIVGFSQMTSIASSKGDVGAEMLSSQIGAYFDMAIRIIEYHGGDVVKFLGDALLVVFQPDPLCGHSSDESTAATTINPTMDPSSPEDAATSLRRNKILVRKAVECGLELLARLSNYKIYLSEREFSRKLSTSDDSSITIRAQGAPGPGSGQNDDNYGPFGIPNVNQGGNGNAQWNSYATSAAGAALASSAASIGGNSFLSVPVMKSSSSIYHGQNGQSSNGGSGNTSRRSSVPTESLSPVLPSRFSPGRHHISRDNSLRSFGRPRSIFSRHRHARAFLANAKHFFKNSNFCDRQVAPTDPIPEDSHELQLHLALSAGKISNIIIGDIGQENGLDNLLLQTTGRLEYAICGEQMATIDDALNMARAGELTISSCAWNFINKEAYPWFEPRRNCYILRNIQPVSDHPLLRRIRNDKLLNTSMGSNPHYYKYINKSAIHRLILHPDGAFPAQFRTVTILFVSLGYVKPWTSEGLATCQKAICQIHHVTSEYEGFIQQFAVDDKGATVLCAFGLPFPRSHEREAAFAAKSAWVIRHRLLVEGIRGFKISLATGVIFTSMIGNEFRRDPAIVGDTIVIAVRILKFEYATESIVCDDATKEACTSDHDDMCEFEDMGEEFVKGKIHPLRIWKLVRFGAKKQIRRPDDVMVDETIGYEPERKKVTQFIKSWEADPDRNTIIVTGPKGSGKSIFYQQICHIADKNGYHVCSAASAEVEKRTEYYLCKFLLLGLFDIMKRKEIPFRAANPTSDLGITYGEDLQRQQSATGSTYETAVGPEVDPNSRFSVEADGCCSPIESHFEPSKRSSINMNSPWPISPTSSQFSDPFKRDSSFITKIRALISMVLQKMGEDLSMVPILVDIIYSLSCGNPTPVTDGHDDEILAEFIIHMLNYASEFVKIIVMFEDIQWTDEKSQHIIHVIHEHCPKVLVVIFSRPQRDYGSNILHCITGHPKHLEISLEGLKRREIEKALLMAFRDKSVTKISPEVIQFVQAKTKGNPKFVKNMADMLKDFYIVNIVDGELLTTGQESTDAPLYKDMEAMLVKQDQKKMILMQYDRMPPRFQEFLKIASCLGGQFSLAEVAAIKPLESLLGPLEPGKSFLTKVSDTDKYKLLSLATDQWTNIQFSDNVVMNTLYTFTSESTATYIYESIPYEERVAYHLTMAQFYESFLDTTQASDLLPLIEKHYLKTDHTEKKIKYLKAISSYYLKSNMLIDASQSLNDLIEILNTERDAAGIVSQEDLAEIYGMKGEALSKRMRIEEAEIALLDSLARYGIQWPKTPPQWRVALFKERTRFSLHHHGGPTLVHHTDRVPKARVDAKTQVLYQRIIRVLGCLQNVYFWRTEPQAVMLAILYTLSYSRKLGIPSVEHAVSLGRYGLVNYLKGNKNTCMEYMDKARIASDAGEGTEGMLPSMMAYVEYCEGHLSYSHQLLSAAIDECKSFGVVSNLATYYRSVTMKCAYRMWEGSFGMREEYLHLRAMSTVAIQNGDSDGEALFAIPTLSSLLLQDRLRDAESWVVLTERFIMPKSRLMNVLVIHAMLSYYYAKMGAFDKAMMYAELMAERILEQGPAANPFPMMSCMFTVMALYEIFDSLNPPPCRINIPNISVTDTTASQVAPGSPVGNAIIAKRQHYLGNAELILRPVIQCLSEDPLQSIGQCFIVLAEALRCFAFPGRNREGFQRLLRGWEKMKDKLEGIAFVRAYFLTKLGQYAEDPEVKDGFYCEAYILLHKTGVNTARWLTDPTPGWQPPQVENAKAGYSFETILSQQK